MSTIILEEGDIPKACLNSLILLQLRNGAYNYILYVATGTYIVSKTIHFKVLNTV